MIQTPEQTDLQRRNELRQGDEEEVQVEKEFELFVEDDREEGEDIIFLIADDVGRISILEFLCETI